MTSTPQFKPQKHTAPFLLASTALPDPNQVIVVDVHDPQEVDFSASVVSQDDPPGSNSQFENVQSVLYIDYGVQIVPTQPSRWYIQDGPVLSSGTLDQTTGRVIKQTWYPQVNPVARGCHTATLVASHVIDSVTHCYECSDDFSSITWQVLSCDSSIKDDCATLPVAGSDACPAQTNAAPLITCPALLAELDAGACPESSGGTP